MSTTKRFTWVNRETACRDLLQLAYHAPGFISQRALQLLALIRPPISFVSELEAIALDEERYIWDRRYALRALGKIPGEVYLPSLVPYSKEITDDLSDSNLDFYEISVFCSFHPENYVWLFQDMEQAEPDVYWNALQLAAGHLEADDASKAQAELIRRFITCLEKHPDLLDLKKVELLWSRGVATADAWLNAHLEDIVALCIQANDAEQIYNFLWPELETVLWQANPILAAQVEQKIKELTSKSPEYSFSLDEYTTSPIWQRLHSLYLAAQSGEQAAFYQLRKTAMSDSLIPVQATATYFIGLLQDYFPDATNLLCKLSHYGLDGWDKIEGCYYHAPVRSEAIKALQRRPSPQVWEELIESFFIAPSNALDLYFDEVIPKVTDVLESGVITHQPIPEELPVDPWFYALLDLPDTPT